MVAILGGKGAGLAEMTKLGLNVPPGFTISAEACPEYLGRGTFPEGLWEEVLEHLKTLQNSSGKEFGGLTDPLLVSVRSGAAVSMPGMMDTILNVGLNDRTVEVLAAKTSNRRFALDSYRRLIQMFGNVVMNIPHSDFEEALIELKIKEKIKSDNEFTDKSLRILIDEFKEIYVKHHMTFPQDPLNQLKMAIEAVFKSWNTERAVTYRELNDIPDDLGTAVSIVSMVFGNMGDDSATGVAFTRDPNTGERKIFAEYLSNAQGEDVVAGIRTPREIQDLKKEMPEAFSQLIKSAEILEKHYRDMQDIEFTIEKGKFYLLQTRSGKRSARAAIKVAVDLVEEGLIKREEAILRVMPETLDTLLHPQVRYNGTEKLLGKGLAASPGAASGTVVFSSERAVELSREKRKIILVRPETTADDVRGMAVSEGFLTQKGGMTSHAAVVARAMGKPAVVGVETMNVNLREQTVRIGDTLLREDDTITVDGTNGQFILGEATLETSSITSEANVLLKWCDEYRKLGIRANANTPLEARVARENGAEGIGLARTERMFLGNDRIQIMRAMIMSASLAERLKYLDILLPMQIADFTEFFRTMDGYPVIIRLLDPPLHEFLPDKEDILNEIFDLKLKLSSTKDSREMDDLISKLSELKRILDTVKNLEEFNPMLGFRGCRLGLSYPEIYEMQVKAIITAAAKVKDQGHSIFPEIMIPLIGHSNELRNLRTKLEKVATKLSEGAGIEYKFGTMIEIPRACVTADQIAKYADFFSFGTNDLTQMTFGYSRDDAEGKFLASYLEEGILESDPFITVDEEGVGELMKMAVYKGKQARKDLEIGICGEQGGDPETIYFCHRIGLDYVSASPHRIPVARLSAARASLLQAT
ncbi:MAG: pyruvate, phosphate dikinase [Candidatus Thermoplasmatota archaeon]|nr:pyruvate, phosphate dikinase [Candidatus Thermoplasmatota archaeon]